MICTVLTLFLILTSCGEKSEPYSAFAPPFKEEVTFLDSGAEFKGTLAFDGETLTFLPLSPKGLKITITEDGGKTEYNGVTFDKYVIPSSRLLPIYQIMKDIAKGEKGGIRFEKNPLSFKKGDLKLIIDKDEK